MSDKSELITTGVESLPSNRHSTPVSTDSPIQTIAKLASSGASTEVIQQMKDLVEWDESRRSKAEFNAAFSNAKADFKQAKKSGANQHLKDPYGNPSRYSLLSDYDDATKDALSKNGLSWRHNLVVSSDEIIVTCILSHKSGHFEETTMTAPHQAVKNNGINPLQAMGSVRTYLIRMTLSAILGLVSSEEVDDDGNAAGELISAEQAAEMKADLQRTNSNVGAFLKYCGAKDIDSMTDAQYKKGKAMLDQKAKKSGVK